MNGATAPQENESEAEAPQNEQKTSTNDQLIYKFDEDDHEKQKDEKEEVQEQKKQESQDDQYGDDDDQEDDEKTIIYNHIDSNLMTFQPLFIIPVILNNSFSLDVVGIICLCVSFVLFVIFNLKGLGEKYKALSSLYLLPVLGSMIMFYVNDHDMST